MSSRTRCLRSTTPRSAAESGFTLIEILVVILVISILAAIAIPMFLRQRDKAFAAQVRSSLREAVSAAEAAALEAKDGYASLDQNVAALYAQGFSATAGIMVGIAADSDSFCVAAHHQSLSSNDPWKTGGYDSSIGAVLPGAAICPQAGLLTALPSGAGTETTAPETTDSESADSTDSDEAPDVDSNVGGDSTGTAGEGGSEDSGQPDGDTVGSTPTSPTAPTQGTTKPKKRR